MAGDSMTAPSSQGRETQAGILTGVAIAIGLAVIGLPVVMMLLLLNAWGAFPRWGEAERRTLPFGDGPSLGELRLIQHANCFTCYEEDDSAGDAVGTVQVKVPDDRWHLKLIVSDAGVPHLSQLQQLPSGGVETLDLANAPVTDADLNLLAHLSLQKLDLSGTGISGSGLQQLQFSDYGSMAISLRGAQKLSQEALIALGNRPGSFSLDLYGSNLDQPETLAQIREAWCPGAEPQSCAKQIQ